MPEAAASGAALPAPFVRPQRGKPGELRARGFFGRCLGPGPGDRGKAKGCPGTAAGTGSGAGAGHPGEQEQILIKSCQMGKCGESRRQLLRRAGESSRQGERDRQRGRGRSGRPWLAV